MDKHEYKMCADEIKSLINRKKFIEAMNLADTVDWSRVKNVNMLCTVSDLYKLGKRYADSRNIMLMAYERHPGDRMIVYSICELSIKLDDVVAAVEYYKEFAQASPNDNRRFILQYKLYEAQEVTIEERIDVLKNFKARERREKWMYELAYLYHRIGLESECIEECDDLFLWFGTGKYVRKALELKMLHTTLTPEQQAEYDGVKLPKQSSTSYGDDEEEEFENFDIPSQTEDFGDEMLVPPVNVGKYATINLQRELAEQIQEVMGTEDDEGQTGDIGVRRSTSYNENEYEGQEYDGYGDRGYSDQSYDSRDYEDQGYDGRGYENLGYDGQGYNDQDYDGHRYEDQGYDNRGYDYQGYTDRSYGEDGYADEGYDAQGYGDQGYDDQSYNDQGYDDNASYGQNYNSGKNYGNTSGRKANNYQKEEIKTDYRVKTHPYKKNQNLSDTEQIRQFESDLGNTTEFRKYEAYANSGVIPPLDGAMGTSAGSLSKGMQEAYPADELYDVDGEEQIANAPGKGPGIAPGRAGKVGETTGNIIDRMMEGSLDGNLQQNPTSSIREITLPDEPEPEEPLEPQVVQMTTGRIPKIVDSVGSRVNTGEQGQAPASVVSPGQVPESSIYPAYDRKHKGPAMPQIPQKPQKTEAPHMPPKPKNQTMPAMPQMPTAEAMARESNENYDRMLSQESDGQISLAMESTAEKDKQITGQISLTETLLAWEEKKKQAINKRLDIEDNYVPEIKRAPLDVAALTKGGVPTDTAVLMSRAREVVEGRAPLENAAVSKIIEPFKGDNYDPQMEAAQMDAAVNAVAKAAEAANARNMDNRHLNRQDEDVPIYEDAMGNPKSGKSSKSPESASYSQEPDENGNPAEGSSEEDKSSVYKPSKWPFYNGDGSPGRGINDDEERERRSLTAAEKKLFGSFIQTKGTLNQILDALDNVTLASYTGNIILTGEPDMGTVKLARALIKEIQNNDSNFSGRLAKIDGDALNRKDIGRTFSQLNNGALIVEGASRIDEDTVYEILQVLDREEQGIIVILEDTKINMNKLLNSYEALYDPFNLRIDLEAMDNDSLVNFAKRYAQDREYSIDEMGILELYTRISDLQTSEHTVTTRDVKQIVDEAIEKADKRNITHLVDIVMGKRYDEEDMVILRAKDFNQ